MIERASNKSLYNKINKSMQQLKNIKTPEERFALSNYIVNLYSAIEAIEDNQVSINKKSIFGSEKNYKKHIRKIDFHNIKLIDNYILYKDFHKKLLGNIIKKIDNNIDQEEILIFNNLSENDFYDIFYQFMKSINLELLFDEFIKNKNIYVTNKNDDTTLGFALYNPLNKNSDIFINDFDYSLDSMLVLAHEFGHIYDFNTFNEEIEKYNKYFYESFYSETYSKLFEKLLLDFLYKQNILHEQTKNLCLYAQANAYEIILCTYILSLLDNEVFKNNSYTYLSKKSIINAVKKYFNNNESILDCVNYWTTFDLLDDYSYAYGEIISLFLKEEINKNGLDNELINNFNNIRSSVFTPDFIVNNNIDSEKYLKIYRKDIEKAKN